MNLRLGALLLLLVLPAACGGAAQGRPTGEATAPTATAPAPLASTSLPAEPAPVRSTEPVEPVAICKSACDHVLRSCPGLDVDACKGVCDEVPKRLGHACDAEFRATGECAAKASEITCVGSYKFTASACTAQADSFRSCAVKHSSK